MKCPVCDDILTEVGTFYKCPRYHYDIFDSHIPFCDEARIGNQWFKLRYNDGGKTEPAKDLNSFMEWLRYDNAIIALKSTKLGTIEVIMD